MGNEPANQVEQRYCYLCFEVTETEIITTYRAYVLAECMSARSSSADWRKQWLILLFDFSTTGRRTAQPADYFSIHPRFGWSQRRYPVSLGDRGSNTFAYHSCL